VVPASLTIPRLSRVARNRFRCHIGTNR
jgi:hypothetical protein